MKVFYDTNVLLDVLLGREPFYEDSARTWTLAEMGRVDGYVSAVSFTNVFYIVDGARDREEAERVVHEMVGIFTPAACNDRVIRQAVEADISDFEDAVQYFSALHAGADNIITRNAADFPRQTEMPVLSPQEFLAKVDFQ